MTVTSKRARRGVARGDRTALRPAARNRRTERAARPIWLIGAALLLATLAAYQPAWNGGLLWDDDKHVTSSELQSLAGLVRIWFEVGATQQYYPLAHSTFWLEHRLWGDATTGYHLVNIALHVLSACLVLVILQRLAVPGALLAAVIFALHPVHVESVAWISELKNTLSGVFFLAAALAYLTFDRDRKARPYAISLALFLLALLSKSVTATLPGVLLVTAWWQRGRLEWRRDVVPVFPFVAIGAAAGLFTAWVERTYIGAEGPEFQLTLLERALVAGRAFWFYLSKLFWPADLTFVYPRWSVDQADVWQYLYPLGALALLAGCVALRRRTRAPLAALLAFCGMLFPVMGFLNVYPFRFSFVADHFQYLASIAVIALVSACAATVANRWGSNRKWLAIGGVLAVAGTLGTLTWNQSHEYTDAPTLYRAVLHRNPSSWLAHSNLGALLRTSAPDEALVHLTEAVRLKPDLPEAHYTLANLLQQTGRLDDAIREYHETIRLSPGMALAYYNLGNTVLQMGRLDEARGAFDDAIRRDPNLALAHSGLGRVLQMMERPDDAVRACETAVRLQPDLAVIRYDFAGVLQAQGRLEDAVTQYTEALRVRPDAAEVHNDLGSVLQQLGRFAEARKHFETAVSLSPDVGLVHSGLCNVLQMTASLDEAGRECEIAIRLQPDLAVARYHLANILQQQKRLEEAEGQYREALRLEPAFPEAHVNLASAVRSLGRAAEAEAQEREALRVFPDEASARSMRAAALEGRGRLREARDEYARALRLAPGLTSARQGIARIEAAQRAQVRQ